MTRKTTVILIALLLPTVLLVGVALARSNCPDCAQQWTFDSGLQGWTGQTAEWQATHTLGMFFTSDASGVAHFNGGHFNLNTYVGAGTYTIKFKAGMSGGAFMCPTKLYLDVPGAGYSFSLRGAYDEWQTGVFTFTQPGYRNFEFRNNCGEDYYFDYIGLYSDTSNGLPTATPMPATATPLPLPTEYCVPAASPTPRAFSLTPVPTAAPVSALSYIDSFERSNITNDVWSTNGTIYSSPIAHSGMFSVHLPSSSDPGETIALGATPALVFEQNFTGSNVYVDLWAQADFVAAGQTQSLGIWLYAADTGNWIRAGSVNVSIGAWYPWHLVAALDHTYTRMAFIAYGTTSSGSVYLDDVHIYSQAAKAKVCGTTLIDSYTGDTVGNPGDYSYTLSIDANRPCPAGITTPNNFWGAILTAATRFLDFITQNWGAHDFGVLTAMSRDLVSSPIMTFAALAALFIDLRLALTVAGIILTGELVRAAWSIWILIKSTVFAR